MTNTVERTVVPRILRAVALCFLGLLGVFAPRGAAQGIITTVAGGGGLQSGSASSVLLPHPVDVAKDKLGNLFILSDATAAVYKVDSSGNLSVVAGNGLESGGANGVLATTSSLNGPEAIAIDPAGNLIIADSGPSVVRRVDAFTGIMSVIAGSIFNAGFSGDGGPAINALLNRPTGVALDSSANIFIVDSQNQRVRRIDAVTGVITTIAGNGTSGFSGDGGLATNAQLNFGPTFFPGGRVAVDSFGNLFIVDSANMRIRRVDASTHVITTVAGNGSNASGGDGGLATLASLSLPVRVAVDALGNLFIAELGGNRIREVNAASKLISTFAGNGTLGFSGDGGPATSAALSLPEGVTVDSAGSVFIADSSNNRTRKVDTSGIITTVAGNGSLGDGGPATSAALFFPNAVAVDKTGNFYVADTVNSVVRRVDAVTGVITHVAGVNDICGISGDGIPAASAALCGPDGVAVDGSGNLFISDSFAFRIRRVDAVSGIITTVAGNGTSGFSGDGGSATNASLAFPSGVALDNAGNLFIDDANNNRIRRVDAVSGIITTVAGNGTSGFSGDGGLATNAALNLSSPFTGPGGLAVDAAGNLFFTDVGNARVRRVDAVTGNITTVAGSSSSCKPAFSFGDGGPATSASLCFPQGVAVDPKGMLYLSDNGFLAGYERIRRVDATTGIITTIAGTRGGFSGDGGLSINAGFEFLRGIALFGANSLFVVDSNALRIRRIALAPAPPPTTSSNFTDPTVTQTVSGGELILHKELSGFPNYGVTDGAADILFTGQAATWHFPVPASTPGLSCAHFQVSVIADDHYGVPPSAYQLLAWVNGKLDVTPPPTLPHGVPFGSRFTNWVHLNYFVSATTSPFTITLANASSGTGPGDWFAVDWIELHVPLSCAVSSSAVKLVSAEFRGSDFFGVTTPTFSGVEPAATALDPLFGAADVWNQLNISPFPALDVNPTWSNLVASTGAQTPVSFSITGTVIGGSLYAPLGTVPGFVNPDPLRSDFLAFNSNSTTIPGESTTIQWQITGLAPNARYDMCIYGARADVARSFNMTIGGTTLNIPTLLFNDPSASSCVLFQGILSDASGTISGVGTGIGSNVGFLNEANWSGFQIAAVPPQTVTTPPQPVAPGTSTTFTSPNVINQTVTIPPNANMNGAATMVVSFIQVSPAVFNATIAGGTNGNAFSGGKPVPAGTTCTIIAGAGGNCIITENKCFDATGKAFALCPITATTTPIQLTSSYKAVSPQPNPALLIASDGQSNYAVITTGFNATDVTISGGTKALNSDEVIGNLPGSLPTDTVPPTTTATTSPPAPNGANGWFTTSPVSVILASTDDTLVKQITYSATGAQPIASTTVLGASTFFQIANQGVTTISYQATDQAGNVEASKTLTVMIDTTPPSISITSPVNGASYLLNQPVAASYTCADPESSPAPSCTGPVASGSNIDTASVGNKVFVVNSTDAAGLSSTQSVSYSVSYNICILYDPSHAVASGSTIPLKMFLCDASGKDVSNPGVIVHATKLIQVSPPATDAIVTAGNANPNNDFRFDSTLGPSGGYIFNLMANLPTGTYKLFFIAGNDPSTSHFLTFQVN